MSSVGETLRRERLRKGLSLDQISRETKISSRFLDAIEKEQFELLPGGVFARSFLRQYARFLGLDEAELVADFEKAIHPVPDPPIFTVPPSEPLFKVPKVMEWPGGDRSSSSALPALAMVVAVMLMCSVIYAWWQRSRHPVPATSPPAAVQKAPAPAPPAPPEAGNAGPTLHVSLSADADSWVQAWADGKSVIIGVLPPNSVKTVEASDSVRIRTGNAGGLQVTVNGKPAGPIGPSGQVRTVEISRDRVQILPPPPKPAPAPALEPL